MITIESSPATTAISEPILRSLSHDLREPIRSIKKRLSAAVSAGNAPEFNDRIHATQNIIDEIGSQIRDFRDKSRRSKISFREIELFIGEKLTPTLKRATEIFYTISNADSGSASRSIRVEISKADQHIKRLARRIDSISQYATAKGELNRTTFGLHNEVKRVFVDLEQLITSTQCRISLTGSASVFADQIKIAQVIQNLIENAIKYRRPYVKPQVKVEIEIIRSNGEILNFPPRMQSKSDDLTYTVVLNVIDNGSGITTEEQSKIFNIFYRGRNSTEQTADGSGLGLAIVHDIVQRHGGSIEVRSKLNSGSEFRISLPQSTFQTEPPRKK